MDGDVDRLDSELVSWRSDRAQAERQELRERGVDVGRHFADEEATLQWLSLRSPSTLVAGFAVQVSRSSIFPWLKLLRIEGLRARSLDSLGDRAGGLLASIVSSSKTILRLNVSLFEPDPAARDRIARLLTGAGFEATDPRSYVETLLLDLNPDTSAIFSKLSTSTRRNIREAEKAGVLVKREREVASTALLSEMLRASFQRHNAVSEQSIKLVETLASDPDACLLVAYWGPPDAEKRPVAFALFRRFGQVAVYDIAGSYRTPEMGRLPVMFPVLWQGMVWAREAGCTLFDFGGVAPEGDQDDPRIGISRFKEGFGGTRALVGGEWRHSSTSWQAKLISSLRRFRVQKKEGT